MLSMESVINELSDQELNKAFAEYDSFRSSGELENGIIRKLIKTCEEKLNIIVSINSIIEPLLYIIIKRLNK